MRPSPLLVEQALTRAVAPSSSSTIRTASHTCQSCLQQQRRTQQQPQAQHRSFHVSARRRIDPNSFFGRLSSMVTGNKEREEKSNELVKAKQAAAEEQQGSAKVYKTIDGKKYEVAAVVDASVNKDYQPADMMYEKYAVRMGSQRFVEQQLPKGKKYRGFANSKHVPTEEELKTLLWSSAREALQLQAKGSGAENISKLSARRLSTAAGAERPADVFTNAHGHLRLNINETASRIKGDQWMTLKLDDPNVKLAIAKRILSVTGTRLPDRTIYSADTCAALLAALMRQLNIRSTQGKLAYAEEIVAAGTELPNVTIHAHKRRTWELENEIGQGKMIRKALRQRGLKGGEDDA